MSKFKTYYKRKLPHILPIGATFFITFRLFGSLPVSILNEIKDKYDAKSTEIQFDKDCEKKERLEALNWEYFEEFDDILHKTEKGPTWLKKPEVAKIVEEEIKKHDGSYYKLICYCVMSNHVHLVFDTSIQLPKDYDYEHELEDTEYVQVNDIMHRIKGVSAFRINKILGRRGPFWARESFDSYIRNEKDLNNRVLYTINNPVKARLVKDWREWPFTYPK